MRRPREDRYPTEEPAWIKDIETELEAALQKRDSTHIQCAVVAAVAVGDYLAVRDILRRKRFPGKVRGELATKYANMAGKRRLEWVQDDLTHPRDNVQELVSISRARGLVLELRREALEMLIPILEEIVREIWLAPDSASLIRLRLISKSRSEAATPEIRQAAKEALERLEHETGAHSWHVDRLMKMDHRRFVLGQRPARERQRELNRKARRAQ